MFSFGGFHTTMQKAWKRDHTSRYILREYESRGRCSMIGTIKNKADPTRDLLCFQYWVGISRSPIP